MPINSEFPKNNCQSTVKYLIGRQFKNLTEEQIKGLIEMFIPGKLYALKIPITWVIFKNRR